MKLLVSRYKSVKFSYKILCNIWMIWAMLKPIVKDFSKYLETLKGMAVSLLAVEATIAKKTRFSQFIDTNRKKPRLLVFISWFCILHLKLSSFVSQVMPPIRTYQPYHHSQKAGPITVCYHRTSTTFLGTRSVSVPTFHLLQRELDKLPVLLIICIALLISYFHRTFVSHSWPDSFE